MKLSYLTTLICQLGRFIYVRLVYGTAPTGDMFQRKVYKIFREIPNIFGIADEILAASYNDDADYNKVNQ